MFVLTDCIDYARQALPAATWTPCSRAELTPAIRRLAERLGPRAHWQRSELDPGWFDRVILIGEAAESQFDILRDRAGSGELPAGSTVCLAGSGRGFHGHRGRNWTATAGNLHVSVALEPRRIISHFGAVFMALPAVAAALAIESAVPAAKPVGIKWVNDVVVGDAKIAGVIAHTRSSGMRVDHAVLGVGLNVETTPNIERSPFVPRAGSLRELDPRVKQDEVLGSLLHHLQALYQAVLAGDAGRVVSAYRDRSVVLRREVEIHPETHPEREEGSVIAGRVCAIGDDLELILEGRPVPVSRGRLLMAPRGNHGTR